MKATCYLMGMALLAVLGGVSLVAHAQSSDKVREELLGKWTAIDPNRSVVYELDLGPNGSGRFVSTATMGHFTAASSDFEIIGWQVEGTQIDMPGRMLRGWLVELSGRYIGRKRLQLNINRQAVVFIPKSEFWGAKDYIEKAVDVRASPLDSSCLKPLESYCAPGRCPTASESIDQTRARAESPGCFVAAIGFCGDFRVTRSGGGYGGDTRYFRSDGVLVAATRTTDALSSSSCPNWNHFGERITCAMRMTETYCPREERNTLR
jgi:hypothetical protein